MAVGRIGNNTQCLAYSKCFNLASQQSWEIALVCFVIKHCFPRFLEKAVNFPSLFITASWLPRDRVDLLSSLKKKIEHHLSFPWETRLTFLTQQQGSFCFSFAATLSVTLHCGPCHWCVCLFQPPHFWFSADGLFFTWNKTPKLVKIISGVNKPPVTIWGLSESS